MKRQTVGIGFIVLMIVSMFSRAEAGEQYWMADLGVQWNLDSSFDADMLQVASLTYGYGLSSDWAVELEYLQSIGGGAYSRDVTINSAPATEKGEFSLWMTSLGMNYRHLFGDTVYLKAKLAYNYTELDRTSSTNSGDLEPLHNLEMGLGAGFLFGDVIGSSLTAELEYTIYNADLMGLMLGVNATF